MEKLTNSSLAKLIAANKVPALNYNRDDISVGIFHFGVGNFHRAHQAYYMHSLFSHGLNKDFGICGVGVMPQDQKMRDVLKSQDYLYTLVEKSSKGDFSYHVIGSIVDYLYAPDDVDVVIERLCSDEAKIVTLTITEGGYNINSAGYFDLTNVQSDLSDPAKPKSVFGIVVEALRRRKERGLRGFTILSCDNLQENGKIARKAFTTYASALDPSLITWMSENVRFPNSMVDRITPVTTVDDKSLVASKLNVEDDWPVVCEDFIQWVIEDNFIAGRPHFEHHPSISVVSDVMPYELMKLRLLNAGHQAIAYFGLLQDFVYVHDVSLNQLFVDYLNAYMDREATSTLLPLHNFNISAYKANIVERFQNKNILDTLKRLAFDGSDRIAKFVIPVVIDRLKSGESIHLGVGIIASYAKYLDGVSDSGAKIEIIDRAKEKLEILTRKLSKNSAAISEDEGVELFGDVVKNETFVRVFKEIYEKINEDGCKKTMKWLIEMK